jgi:hypothetical protein
MMIKTLILSFFIFAHPVHVTLMSVDCSEKKDVLMVFLKLYSDDFLLDYRMLTGDTARIDLGKDPDKTGSLIIKYINERLKLAANGKTLQGKLISFDHSEGELKIDIVYKNKPGSDTYLVKNTIMTDLYADQINLLIFRYGDFEQSIKLTPEKQEQIFNVK